MLNNVTISNNVNGEARRPIAGAALLLFDGVQTAPVIQSNYFDETGTYGGGGGIVQSYATCNAPVSWANQIDLVSGSAVSKNSGMLINAGSGC